MLLSVPVYGPVPPLADTATAPFSPWHNGGVAVAVAVRGVVGWCTVVVNEAVARRPPAMGVHPWASVATTVYSPDVNAENEPVSE